MATTQCVAALINATPPAATTIVIILLLLRGKRPKGQIGGSFTMKF